MFPKRHFTGVLDDPRTQAQKDQDYSHEERVMATIASQFSNAKITTPTYFPENQWYVGSCVPHGVGLGLAIERQNDTGAYARLAWLFPYRLRSNYPDPGCYPQEIFDLYKKYGAPLYAMLETKIGMTEAQASAIVLTQQMYTEAEIFRGLEYYMLKNTYNDIDELARIAQLGHGVPITIFATTAEWSKTYVTVDNPNLLYKDATVSHEVCVLPHSGFTENGIKYVAIQDSAWFGNIVLRYLPENFVQKRVRIAGYWDTVTIIGNGPKPKFTFTKVLKYGAVSEEVRQMQLLLISEGLLPIDCATGAFYGRTLAGVHAFQNKYADKILLPIGLDAPTDIWGAGCIAQANFLCK